MGWLCAICGNEHYRMLTVSCINCSLNMCGGCLVTKDDSEKEVCPSCGADNFGAWASGDYVKNTVEYHEDHKGPQPKFKVRMARNFEIAMNFSKAVELFEELGLWEDARRCRIQLNGQRPPAAKIEIGTIDQSIGQVDNSTSILDSVVQRSNIGISGSNEKKIAICPYCGAELNFPETPRYCPYCRKQILM